MGAVNPCGDLREGEKPVSAQGTKKPTLAVLEEKEAYIRRLNEPAKVADVERLHRDIQDVLAAVLGQQAEIARLNKAIAGMRVSRTQELALSDAIRRRSKALCEELGMPGECARRIAAAIRTTLREITGARAIGDVQAGQFDAALAQIESWYMTGALRRIAREIKNE